MLGQPLTHDDKTQLEGALDSTGGEPAIRTIQGVLDKYCLIGIEINAESRVKSSQGPARPRLLQNGWSVFLVKVHNEAGVTAKLVAESPNARSFVQAIVRACGAQGFDPSRRSRAALGRCGHVQ